MRFEKLLIPLVLGWGKKLEWGSRVDIKSGSGPEHWVKALRGVVVYIECGFIYKETLLRIYALISVIDGYQDSLVSSP